MKPFSTGSLAFSFRATRLSIACGALAFTLSSVTSQAAVFLDLLPVVGVTPGSVGTGSFTGTLGGIVVSGAIVAGTPGAFSFNAPGPLTGSSTIDGSSPQFSYASVFSDTAPLTDRVGFSYGPAGGTDTVVITFSSPVTNPVFHVANLSGVAFNFGPTPGFAGLTLLAGNGGADLDGIDPAFGGIVYSFAHIQDKAPGAEDSTPPFVPPPTFGTSPRAAYGSVQINGTFTTLVFVTDGMGPATDDGSFTISIPEPGSVLLAIFGAACPACFRHRRR